MARPSEYTTEILEKAKEYLALCQDSYQTIFIDGGKTKDGTPIVTSKTIFKVKVPTIEGLASYVGIATSTVYEWEKKHDEFSEVIATLRQNQADRLISNGLSGDYNPTIAKVLLTKHGYREGLDQTTNDKDIPAPITNVHRNNGISENKQPE